MKNVVKRFARDEKGQAMVLAVILLLVGVLIAAGLLTHMGAGLLAGEVYGRRTAELYAADAGVEDAVWKLGHPREAGYLPCSAGSPPKVYTIDDVINGRNVQVTIEFVDPATYRVTSIATTVDDGGTAAIDSSTAVESYLSASYLDFSSLLDNAIVSYDTITIQPGTEVCGDVWLPDKDGEDLVNKGEIVCDGEVKDEEDISITWPTAEQLSTYYWYDVKHLEEEAYPDGYVMNIPGGTSEGDPYVIQPLLAAGDLTIKGNGWIRLEGTIYVKGTLDFNPTPAINIDLNEHTIFAEGEIKLNPGVTLYGSGCIIAVGNINFQPNLSGEEGQYVLVLSVQGATTFNPGTDFYGTVAGNAHVQLQPHNKINWIDPEDKGLHFPGMGDDDKLPPVTGVSIKSWEIKQQ